MPPSKDSLALRTPNRRIEWEIVVFMAMVFIIPLVLINTGILGIKHPQIKSIGTHHQVPRHIATLPYIHPLIEAAFDGNRPMLWQELSQQCWEIRNLTQKIPSSACSLGNEELFDKFLDVMRKLFGHHESITKESWRAHCHLQLTVKDTRTPILCEAAAFVALPFPLRPENRKKIEDVSLLELRENTKQIDPSDLKLIVVTIYSSYHSKLKAIAANKVLSLTIKSSCYRNISVNLLGSGNKEIPSEPGMKINLLKSFVGNMKDIENSVILYVDGEDILFQADSHTILNKFLAMNKRVLFGAEHSCFPLKSFPWNLNLDKWLGPCTGQCSNSRYICDTLYPQPNSALKDKTNRWLNSGGFIAYASDLKDILNSVSHIPADFLSQWPGTDQGLYSHLMLAGHWNIGIDFESKIFLNFGLFDDPYESYVKRPTTKTLLKEAIQYDPIQNKTRTWKHSLDGSVPSIIHFNADGRTILESVNKNYMPVNYLKCKKTIKSF